MDRSQIVIRVRNTSLGGDKPIIIKDRGADDIEIEWWLNHNEEKPMYLYLHRDDIGTLVAALTAIESVPSAVGYSKKKDENDS